MDLKSVVASRLPDGYSFEEIYITFRVPIYRHIYHLVGNPELANDLTQDTFLKVFRAFPELPLDMNITAWLFRIATNTAYDALRRDKIIQFQTLSDSDFATTKSRETDPVDEFEVTELVHLALQHMPMLYRNALLLYTQSGYTYSQLAQYLNIGEKGVKMYLSRARQSFRKNYSYLLKG